MGRGDRRGEHACLYSYITCKGDPVFSGPTVVPGETLY